MSHLPLSIDGALNLIVPALRSWWKKQFPESPTTGQRLAWPSILQGQNILLSAPTGTGKTLAALMPVYQEFLVQRDPRSSGVKCLYLAPLKALCNDLHVRITNDLQQLRECVTNELYHT